MSPKICPRPANRAGLGTSPWHEASETEGFNWSPRTVGRGLAACCILLRSVLFWLWHLGSGSDILVLALMYWSWFLNLCFASDIYLVLALASNYWPRKLVLLLAEKSFYGKGHPSHELPQEPLEVNQAPVRIRLIAVQLNSTPLAPRTVRSIA